MFDGRVASLAGATRRRRHAAGSERSPTKWAGHDRDDRPIVDPGCSRGWMVAAIVRPRVNARDCACGSRAAGVVMQARRPGKLEDLVSGTAAAIGRIRCRRSLGRRASPWWALLVALSCDVDIGTLDYARAGRPRGHARKAGAPVSRRACYFAHRPRLRGFPVTPSAPRERAAAGHAVVSRRS